MDNKVLVLVVYWVLAISSALASQQKLFNTRGNSLKRLDDYCIKPELLRYGNRMIYMQQSSFVAYSVCTDGFIFLLLENQTDITPMYDHNPQPLASLEKYPMVAGFWADANPSCPDNRIHRNMVTYSECSSRSQLYLAKYLVNDDSFIPKSLVIATYNQMRPYGGCKDLSNTFQIVLATGGQTTYAIFIYRSMQWDRHSSSTNMPVIGYTDVRGHSYQYNLTNSPTTNTAQRHMILKIGAETAPGAGFREVEKEIERVLTASSDNVESMRNKYDKWTKGASHAELTDTHLLFDMQYDD